MEDSDPLSSNGDGVVECNLFFDIQTESSKSRSTKTRQTCSIPIHQPFYPASEAVRVDMDGFVWGHLSLQMQCSDDRSHLVYRASLAGAYLTLILPRKQKNQGRDSGEERHAKKQVTKFSLLRFAALLDDILGALRSLDSGDPSRDHALSIIAAAGVLYCELEHVNQNFQSGKHELLYVSDPYYVNRSTASTEMCYLLFRVMMICKYP